MVLEVNMEPSRLLRGGAMDAFFGLSHSLGGDSKSLENLPMAFS